MHFIFFIFFTLQIFVYVSIAFWLCLFLDIYIVIFNFWNSQNIITHRKLTENIKIKVNKENALDFSKEVMRLTQVPLRIDANEAFQTTSDVMNFISAFPDLNRIEFLEQPLPASFHEEALELKKHSPVILIADESVTKEDIGTYYTERFHGVNIKLMKSGGYLKGLKQLRQAKILGLKTMLGCMVETSLGISSALQLAGGVDYFDLDGFLFWSFIFNLLLLKLYHWATGTNCTRGGLIS